MTDPFDTQDLLAAVDGSAYPLSDEECVFRSRSDDEKHVMTFDVLRAMDTCSRFRTFDEHVRQVTNRQGKLQGQEVAVRQVLDNAVRRGLFVSARDWLAGGAGAGRREGGAPIPVFIRAGGRETQLRALLDSARRLESGTGNRHRYIAVEDGRTPEARDACRRAVREAEEQGLDCHILDLDRQARIVDRVMDRAGLGGDEAVRGVLLGGARTSTRAGRVRNVIHLAAAGVPHLTLDDDLTLAPRRDPSAAGGVDLDTAQWSFWFYPDAAGVAAWGEEAGDFDPVAAHYEALGLDGARALRRFARGPEDLAGLDLRAVERMAAGGILATQSGMYGDAASANNIWYYLARGASLDRLQGDPAAYEGLRTTRYLARTRGVHAFQSVGAFSPVGAANDRMLPPTLHTGRNEDTFYTAVLHSLYPRSRVLEFPWALGHFPEEREWPELAWDGPFTGNLSRFLAGELVGLSHQVPEITGEARYRVLSQRLAVLGAGSDRQLLDRVAAFQVAQRTQWIQRLNQARRDAGRPAAGWERDVKAIIRVNGQSLESGVPRRVHDMPDDLNDAEAAAWLRQRIEPLSRALAAWPALWQAALELQPLEDMGLVRP